MDLLKNITAAIEELTTNDPLLQRGIKRDWVCVINPALVRPILELEKTLTKFPSGSLNYITGRETHILNSAPTNEVQYMPREEMYGRYADEFIAQARLAAITPPANE